MTNYEWLTENKERFANIVSNDYFMDYVALAYCAVCPNKMFCEKCTIDPSDMLLRWLELEHK